MASAEASEAVRLSEDTGRSFDRLNALGILALIDAARGREEARHAVSVVIDSAAAMGARGVEALGYSTLGLLELGTGRPEAAIPALERCGNITTNLGLLELGHLQWAAELVEALVRSGSSGAAEPTMQIMRSAVNRGGTQLTRALLARCEGLTASDESWESHFSAALAIHAQAPSRPFEVARTHLAFGERLRRQRRRREARNHLGDAWKEFSTLGAPTRARRAADELAATGLAVHGQIVDKTGLLTPQELQVALAVAAGGTNRTVAKAMFLSQKTIEFHLNQIYQKLGLSSRAELVRLVSNRYGPQA